MEIAICIIEHIISDGSSVFDVHLGIEAKNETVIPAFSHENAVEMANTIADSIRWNSATNVKINEFISSKYS